MAIEQNQNYLHTGEVEFQGGVKIVDGAEGVGKVLTSDASGNATWQASGSGVVQSVTRTLTSAEILALHTTPIELIPAQGANTTILPLSFIFNLNYGTTPYTVSGALEVFIGANAAASNYVQSVYLLGFMNSNQDCIYRQTYDASTGAYTGSSITIMTNNPLLVFAQNSNPTLGDSQIEITVLYSVITI